jgi:hypothetical protein
VSTNVPGPGAQSSSPASVPKKAGKATTPAEHRVQVAAAKLRVVLDERLGRPTPPEAKALSEEDL